MTLTEHDQHMTTAANTEHARAERFKHAMIAMAFLAAILTLAGAYAGYHYAMDQVNQCVASLGTDC